MAQFVVKFGGSNLKSPAASVITSQTSINLLFRKRDLTKALAAAGVNVLLTQAGASPVAMYVIIKKEDKSKALQAIHETIQQGVTAWGK